MVEGKITMRFGQRYPMTFFFVIRGLAGRRHKGIDIANKCGTPIKAPEHIIQTFVGRKYGYGNVIEAKGKYTKNTYRWAHLQNFGIPRIGKEWKKGEVFTWIGNTGFSTGCHVHIEKRIDGLLVDPLNSLLSQVNKAFREVFNRNPNVAQSTYWQKRVTSKKLLRSLKTYKKLTGKMKWYRDQNRTKGK